MSSDAIDHSKTGRIRARHVFALIAIWLSAGVLTGLAFAILFAGGFLSLLFIPFAAITGAIGAGGHIAILRTKIYKAASSERRVALVGCFAFLPGFIHIIYKCVSVPLPAALFATVVTTSLVPMLIVAAAGAFSGVVYADRHFV